MGAYKDLNDYEIMYLVSENDENAKEVLFQKYYPIIVRTANRYKEEAKKYGLEIDDLVQEGYYGLSCAMNCYNPNKDAMFYTYAIMSIKSKIVNALRIAGNKKSFCLNNYISLFRKIDPNKEATIFDFVPDNNVVYPEEVLLNNEMMFLLKDFLFSLKISSATIFELKLNGFSTRDISELMGVSVRSVSNVVCRNNEKLRKFLEMKKINNYN